VRWRVGDAVQIGGCCLIQMKRFGQRLQYLIRRPSVAPLLKTQVVLRADPGKTGNLFAAQTLDAASCICGETDVARQHRLAPCAQVVSELIDGHEVRVGPAPTLALENRRHPNNLRASDGRSVHVG
jgi:hypothetical protein